MSVGICLWGLMIIHAALYGARLYPKGDAPMPRRTSREQGVISLLGAAIEAVLLYLVVNGI